MITFVTTAEHQYTIRDVLETRRHALHGRLVILSYDELLSFRRLPVSTYIFADLERLDEDDTALVIRRIEALRQVCPECRMLNLPDRIGDRLDIMRRLHQAGINDFRMLPISTAPEVFNYPVFLRRPDDHDGPVSDLLETPQALEDAIAALDPTDRMGDRLAVTEYVDARNELGLHEKRSYTRVGDRLFPSALDQSSGWVCKGEHSDPATIPAPERELAFLRGAADEAILRAAFDAAHIQYGRADYALVGGRPQIFEINTNPWLEPPEQVPAGARAGAEHIVGAWIDALDQLAGKVPTAPLTWQEVPQAQDRAAAGISRRKMVRWVLCRSHQIHNDTSVMRWLRRLRLL